MPDRLRRKRDWPRNRVAASLLVAALASVLWVRWSQIPRTVTGTLPDGLDTGMIRLCSVDRVLQSKVDKRGHFTFLDVPPDTYQLTETLNWGGSKVKTGTALTTVVAIEWRGAPDGNSFTGEERACLVDPTPRCGVYAVKVEYGERRAQASALILGLIENTDGKRLKLAGAKVLLTNARDHAERYSAVSDNDGHFRFAPPAGVYVMSMSVRGFARVAVPDFLVPQENDTIVTLQTSAVGETAVIQYCQ